MRTKTRILIADDNADVRADLRMLFTLTEDVEVVGEAATGNETILFSKLLTPDIIVMDLEMSMDNPEKENDRRGELVGIRALKKIKTNMPGILIVVLTVHDYEQAVKAAKAAGADAFLVKGRDTVKLLEMIKKT